MRILVVSQQFWPENFRINDLTAELVRRGHEVTVLTGAPNYPEGKVFDGFKAEPKRYEQYQGIKIVRVPIVARGSRKVTLVLNYLSYALSATVFGAYKLRGQKFDVIFTYEPSPVTVGIPAGILRRIKRAPMAFWVLDLWPETLSAVGVVRNPNLLKTVGLLVRIIYRNCDLILAQSKSFISQIRKYSGGDKRVEYFPSWSDVEFNLDQVQPASEIVAKAGTFNILFTGNIGQAQDFASILEAVKILQHHTHIRWHIIGDGRQAQWVKSFIEKNGLEKNIVMYGQFPLERMPSFLKHADALLVSLKPDPIFAMTIPGKLQTYLSVGLPVLAMLDGEGADLVERSGVGLVSPAGNPVALAQNVLNMSEMSQDVRLSMGANGKQAMAREFERDELINKLETWLLELQAINKSC
jgi:glycosyltransferase involved in cell wall biosynthesis